MKVKDLYEKVKLAMTEGFEEAEVLFDTEARHYQCHVVLVTGAHAEDYPGMGKYFILFDNNTPHEMSEKE